MRLDFGIIVLLVIERSGDNEPSPRLFGHLNRKMGAFLLDQSSEEQEIVFLGFAEFVILQANAVIDGEAPPSSIFAQDEFAYIYRDLHLRRSNGFGMGLVNRRDG